MTSKPALVTYSKEWFDYTFFNGKGIVPVPADLRSAAEAICKYHDIRGVCDPMYIANVIAFESGRGDGCGKFNEASRQDGSDFSSLLDKVSKRIAGSYGASLNVTPAAIRGKLCAHLKNGSSVMAMTPIQPQVANPSASAASVASPSGPQARSPHP